ncbi:MAG TPA: ribosomal protein L7/L12 [Polyangiaceae bacterium]
MYLPSEMVVEELRCPSCNAPVDATLGERSSCRYCGATVVVREPAPARVRTEERMVIALGHVGPSNASRVARLLHERAGVTLAEAEALVARAPSEVIAGDDGAGARELELALTEAGVDVRVIRRIVTIPLPPDVEISLETTGPNRLAVIHALREHLGLGLVEAKHLVERAPCVVVEVIEAEKGNALEADLEKAGALTKVRPARG